MNPSAEARDVDPALFDLHSLIDRHRRAELDRSQAQASAIIVLRENHRDPDVMLIERAERRGDPTSGQISLPGGRVEEVDTDLRATALREFQEEIGLGTADLDGPPTFVGVEHATVFDLSVAIYAAQLRSGRTVPSDFRCPEVKSVFWLPSSTLSSTTRVIRETDHGPLEVDATVHNGLILWGFTRRVLRGFFGVV